MVELIKLNLSHLEQSILESMGLDTVEEIALCWKEELGLGKGKWGAILNRARSLLAYERIKAIDCGYDAVTVTISDTSRSTIVSVEHVLGVSPGFKREVEGDRLIIFAPERTPCSFCGVEPIYICENCRACLCQECRFKHEHDYYQTTEISSLEDTFQWLQIKAGEYSLMPQEKGTELDDKPGKEVIGIAREMGFDGFAQSFFSELEGNDIMKKAITCALFSTPYEPAHVLVAGEPAGGRTLARDIIARRLGSDIELVGANTTKSGLVCNPATGKPGVLAYADRKVVLTDEFDRIPPQDVEYCYELLSNGKCSIHSANVHETFESHFIMIAFANPIETVFVRDPIQEIGVPPNLLSRFALVVKAEELEVNRRKEILKRKLIGGEKTSEFSRWYLSWLQESRKHFPKFTASEHEIDDYVARVNKLIDRYSQTPLCRDLRMGDHAKRIPMSIARAGFTEINEQTLDEAIALMEACMAAWHQ